MIQYRIYQIKDIENTDYAFRDYDPNKFKFKDYQLVYRGEVTEQEFPKDKFPELHEAQVLGKTVAEAIFIKYNYYPKPADYQAHSLSTSDMLEIEDEKKLRLYYCNTIGWLRIR